jgi:hypothetical protein
MSILSSHKAARYEDLPAEVYCTKCRETKPLDKEKLFCVKRICKACQNARERGHRREYKRDYLRRWRSRNPELAKSYYQNDPDFAEQARRRAAKYNKRHGDAARIQGRMRRRGMPVSIVEAQQLLKQFGRCYPSRFGLTTKGLKECERIRARLRMRAKNNTFAGRKIQSSFEIRLMVYEQSLEDPGLLIPPAEQPVPYQAASRTMTRVQGRFRAMRAGA